MDNRSSDLGDINNPCLVGKGRLHVPPTPAVRILNCNVERSAKKYIHFKY